MKSMIEFLLRVCIFGVVAYITTIGFEKINPGIVMTLLWIFIIVVGIQVLGILKNIIPKNYAKAKVIANMFSLIIILLLSYLNKEFSEQNMKIISCSLMILAIIATLDIQKYKKYIR